MYTGIQKARQEFAARGRSGVKHVAILLTDGYSQSPANDIAEAYNAKNDGIMIFTIGMGMADEATLRRIATITGGDYYNVTNDEDLIRLLQEYLQERLRSRRYRIFHGNRDRAEPDQRHGDRGRRGTSIIVPSSPLRMARRRKSTRPSPSMTRATHCPGTREASTSTRCGRSTITSRSSTEGISRP